RLGCQARVRDGGTAAGTTGRLPVGSDRAVTTAPGAAGTGVRGVVLLPGSATRFHRPVGGPPVGVRGFVGAPGSGVCSRAGCGGYRGPGGGSTARFYYPVPQPGRGVPCAVAGLRRGARIRVLFPVGAPGSGLLLIGGARPGWFPDGGALPRYRRSGGALPRSGCWWGRPVGAGG